MFFAVNINTFYKNTPALFEKSFSSEGFEWISYDDHENCVISYIRKGKKPENDVVVICNLTPTIRENYRIGVPVKGKLNEIFNSDSPEFGGSGVTNKKQITIKKQPWNGKDFSAEMTLAPLAVTIFQFKS